MPRSILVLAFSMMMAAVACERALAPPDAAVPDLSIADGVDAAIDANDASDATDLAVAPRDLASHAPDLADGGCPPRPRDLGAPLACDGGQCSCPPGHADCNGDPADGCEANLLADERNCGACALACAPSRCCYGCRHGSCTLPCPAGLTDCNCVYEDGCEANLQKDPGNCGGCGIQCPDGKSCQQGACV